ncbi:hypothetical protein V6N13_099885 [Hibiscus sabdariffa]
MLRRQRLSTEHSTPETKLRDENKGSRSLPTPKLEVNDGHATMQGKIVVSSGGEENNDPRWRSVAELRGLGFVRNWMGMAVVVDVNAMDVG